MVKIKVLVLLCFMSMGMVACGTTESGQVEEEPRVITRTVTETVAQPEEAAPSEEDSSEQASPEETLELQYQYINSGEYEQAYELFTDDSKAAVTLEQYEAYFEATAPYEITDYSFPSVQVDGDTGSVEAAVTVSTGTAGVQQYPITQQMSLTNEGWRVVMRDEQIESFTSALQSPEQMEQSEEQQTEDSSDESSTSNVIVRVTGSESFSGNYGTLESSRSVDGVAPAEYPVEVDTGFFSMDSVSAVMQKNGAGSGELGVQIVVDGEVVKETSTTAEYGVAQVSWSPSE